MPLKNIQHSKKQKIVQRFKNRIAVSGSEAKKEKDVKIIDTVLTALYNDGDKVTKSLNADILSPAKITVSEKEAARIWDIMVNTGLVNAVIGFGNRDKLSLTNASYQLMNQFGSYQKFIEERDKAQQKAEAAQNMVMPHIVIEQVDDNSEEKEGEEENEGAVGTEKGNEEEK